MDRATLEKMLKHLDAVQGAGGRYEVSAEVELTLHLDSSSRIWEVSSIAALSLEEECLFVVSRDGKVKTAVLLDKVFALSSKPASGAGKRTGFA